MQQKKKEKSKSKRRLNVTEENRLRMIHNKIRKTYAESFLVLVTLTIITLNWLLNHVKSAPANIVLYYLTSFGTLISYLKSSHTNVEISYSNIYNFCLKLS